jgi:hypothetical protein
VERDRRGKVGEYEEGKEERSEEQEAITKLNHLHLLNISGAPSM